MFRKKNVPKVAKRNGGSSRALAGFLLSSAGVAMMITGCGSSVPGTPFPTATPSATSMSQVTPGRISFQDAKRDPLLRQAYLDQLATERGLPEYVSGLKYADEREMREEHGGRKAKGFTEWHGGPDDIGAGKKSVVHATVNAFGVDASTGLFDVIIFGKEFGNARCLYEGLGMPIGGFLVNAGVVYMGPVESRNTAGANPDWGTEEEALRVYDKATVLAATELCGYLNISRRMNYPSGMGLSQQEMSSLAREIGNFYADLWNPEYADIDPKTLDRLKTDYFQPWMMKTKAFGVEPDTGNWYIIGNSGQKAFLPGSVKERYGTALK
ncbi:MAG TPA: hypothetical protein VI979_02935 [archaeon]|nr:hypothetical protein [archaeon]